MLVDTYIYIYIHIQIYYQARCLVFLLCLLDAVGLPLADAVAQGLHRDFRCERERYR